MNDEEIMRKFNETFSDSKVEEEKKENIPVTPYRATTNQNTIPTNMSNQNTSNTIPPLNNNTEDNQKIKKMMEVDNSNYTTYESQQNYAPNVNYNYVPSYGTKKKKTISFKMPKELMPIILIVLILFIIIMIIPTIYDLFTGL